MPTRSPRTSSGRTCPKLRSIRDYVLDKARIRRLLSVGGRVRPAVAPRGFSQWRRSRRWRAGFRSSRPSAPGVSDILADGEASGGIIVPTGDVPALARTVGKLLDDVALARDLGARARRRVEAAFGVDVVGGQLARLLRGYVNA